VAALPKKEQVFMLNRFAFIAVIFSGLTGCTVETTQEVITKGQDAKRNIQVLGTTQDDKVEELLLPGQD
jgi:hypothetical protein